MTKPSPKFYIAESERLSDEDPEKVDRLTHEAVGTRTGKREIESHSGDRGCDIHVRVAAK